MARLLGILALATFALSVLVHLATFIPAIPISMDQVWPLHLAGMALLIAMIFSLVRLQKREPKDKQISFFANWRAENRRRREHSRKILSYVPFPLGVAFVMLFFYVVINFILFAVRIEGGGPVAENGQFFLENHGQKIREITPAEYQRFRAYEVRGASGHWMLFAFLPMTYFLAVRPKVREDREAKGIEADSTPELTT